MNDHQIESFLRQPSRLAAPAALKAQLVAGIRLPSPGTGDPARSGVSFAPNLATFLRRWIPALSLGALLLGCFVVVAWQTSQWLSLRRENGALRSALPDLTELNAEHGDLKSRLAALAPGQLTAAEQEELARLRDEVTQQSGRVREWTTLQAENKRLQAEMAAARAKAGVEAEPDPFDKAQAHAKRINCVSNMKQVGLALRMWANDNKDVFPMDFLSASNELNTPKVLTCVADSGRRRANSWAEFNGTSVSYEFLSPGGVDADPNVVLTRCPIHNTVGLCDGSVAMLGTNQQVLRIDGKWRIVSRPQP